MTREPGDLEAFEQRLGYAFGDRELLATALRHASRSHELPEAESNERLEFLGDAVVGLAVAHRLYAAHPTWGEGELTRALHALVDERAHAAVAQDLDMEAVIELGRTVRANEPVAREVAQRRILANAFEAVVGAMYLDGGFAPVLALVDACFGDAFAPDAEPPPRDPKTALQEESMARFGALPSYALTGDSGVEGDDVRFAVEVRLPDGEVGRGVGRSKRLAERAAAARALARLREQAEARTAT